MLKKYAEQLEVVNSTVLEMANALLSSNKIILEAFENCDVEQLKSAQNSLKGISKKITEMDNVIVKTLALFTPEAADLRLVVSFFKITNEIQRASSNTKSFINSFEVYCNSIDKEDIVKYAIPLHKSTLSCIEGIVDMITCSYDEVRENFDKVIQSEKRTDEIYEEFQSYIFSIDKRVEDFEKFTKILNSLRKNEKIADRTVNMAYLILFARMGGALGDVEI